MNRTRSKVRDSSYIINKSTKKSDIDEFLINPRRDERDEWFIEKGETISDFECLEGHSDGVTTMAFNNDSTLIATGSKDTTVRIFKASEEGKNTFKEVKVITDDGRPVRSVEFSPDGKLLAIGSEDENVFIYRVEGGNFERLSTLKND